MQGACYVPPTHKLYAKAKAYLTLSVFNYAEQEMETFYAYDEDKAGGVYIPRDYARRIGMQPDEVSYGFDLGEGVLQPVELRDEQEPCLLYTSDAADDSKRGEGWGGGGGG